MKVIVTINGNKVQVDMMSKMYYLKTINEDLSFYLVPAEYREEVRSMLILAERQDIINREKPFELVQHETYLHIEGLRQKVEYSSFNYKSKVFSCEKSARDDMDTMEKAYRYLLPLRDKWKIWLDSLTQEEKDALLEENPHALDPPKGMEEFPYKWFTLGGKSLYFIDFDEVPEFCFNAVVMTQKSWSLYGGLIAACNLATTVAEVNHIKELADAVVVD